MLHIAYDSQSDLWVYLLSCNFEQGWWQTIWSLDFVAIGKCVWTLTWRQLLCHMFLLEHANHLSAVSSAVFCPSMVVIVVDKGE